MEDILKTVKSLEDSSLIKRTKKNICMLLGILGASLLGNMLTGKIINRPGEGFVRAAYGSKRSSIKDF